MAQITVTASVTYTYDTEDGFIGTEADAADDVRGMLAAGEVPSGEFRLLTTTVENPER